MKKGLIITGAILLGVGIILIAAALTAGGFDLSVFGAKALTAEYPVDEAFDRIEIETKGSDVVIKPSEDGNCRVVCVEREKVQHAVRVEGSVLKVTADDQRAWYERWLFFARSLSVTLYLPRDTYRSLSVSAGTGDVMVCGPLSTGEAGATAGTAGNPLSTGEAGATAGTGDVLTEETFSFGDISIAVSTGDVVLSGLTCSGSVAIALSTGDVKLRDAACDGSIAIALSTGDISMTNVTCREFISDGSTGDVLLENTVADERIDIERSTGDLLLLGCDAGELKIKTTTGDVTGSLYSEKLFLATSTTGRVSVPDSASGGKCEITTVTGDIIIGIADRGN